MKPKYLSAAFGLVAAVLMATTQPQSMSAAGVPAAIHYQGRVAVSGVPFDGTGHFKFALIGPGANAGSVVTYWSHDGTSSDGSEPTSSVPVKVTKGIYSVLLGDAAVPGMTTVLSPGVFDHDRVELRVWFGGGEDPVKLLSPDQRVNSVAYALVADEANRARAVADGAVGTKQVADKAITAQKLADQSVTAEKLAPNAVGDQQIADNAVTTGKISDGAITATKLADGIIGPSQFPDGSIFGVKIADNAIATAKIADGAITTAKLANGSVVAGTVADGAITATKLANGSVGSTQVADGSIVGKKIENGSITSSKLAPVLSGTIKADRFEGDGTGLKGVITGQVDLRMVRGGVRADGTTFMGEGFTVSKSGKGTYKISYLTPFSGMPAVVASSASPTGAVSWNLNTLESVELTTAIGGTVQDTWFSFIAIGPR